MFPKVSKRFGRICRVAEGQFQKGKLPKWVFDAFRNAAYFQFLQRSDDLPEKEIFRQGHRAISDGFFLPFETTAVENVEAVVIVQDLEENQEGLHQKRRYITAGLAEESEQRKKPAFISWGELNRAWFQSRDGKLGLQANISLSGFLIADPSNIHFELTNTSDEQEVLPIQVGLLCGMLTTVAYFNMPGKFVVEEAPNKIAKEVNKRKITWGAERPRFTVLSPKQIQTLFGDPEEQLSAPVKGQLKRTPHPRRRHRRTYRHDRFERSGLKGHSIIVPATWVGPTEKTIGTKLYKVRIDV